MAWLFISEIGLLFIISLVSGQDFTKMFAHQNQAGLPPNLLVETTNLDDPEQVAKLLSQLEDPEYQSVLREAALQHSADTSRALSDDWDDPQLCRYVWLSWLPWLNCVEDSERKTSIPILFREEGECYKEL